MAGLGCDMMYIYCGWVSTRWQRLVDLYKNRKETAIYKRINNTPSNIKTQITQNRKKEHKRENNIKISKPSNYKIT
jgi:flagellar biosynthesis chaperone FliJ